MMNKITPWMLGFLLAASALAWAQTADADKPVDVADEPVETLESAIEPVAPDEAEASDAMDALLETREEAPVIEPVIEPTGPARQRPEPQYLAPVSATIDIDPAVLGIAPGDDPPPLRREGEFITNRRGRLIRAAETGHRLFVFEADAGHAPELPLVMQACQLLQTMEDTVDRRGESTVFILSGQVHTYRGANYLLPTMMKIAVDTGNLTN